MNVSNVYLVSDEIFDLFRNPSVVNIFLGSNSGSTFHACCLKSVDVAAVTSSNANAIFWILCTRESTQNLLPCKTRMREDADVCPVSQTYQKHTTILTKILY